MLYLFIEDPTESECIMKYTFNPQTAHSKRCYVYLLSTCTVQLSNSKRNKAAYEKSRSKLHKGDTQEMTSQTKGIGQFQDPIQSNRK
jgi:hypothetical protein